MLVRVGTPKDTVKGWVKADETPRRNCTPAPTPTGAHMPTNALKVDNSPQNGDGKLFITNISQLE